MTQGNSDSVLAKLRDKRSRATVSTREDILVPKQEITEALEDRNNLEPVKDNSIEALQKELALFPETVRHSGIVLEKGIDRDLTQFCRDNKITVELFLEAAWCLSDLEPEFLERILVEAKQRYNSRKQAGKTRRLLTMLQK
ncbi:hypothetical protein [Chamaesiphon polymorphus]|uniref:Uncharacterized protein n=1 Tax=Chamaesiphon polymorphus CCALA 037 TaxID=2107692 RepID=A0A2T1GKG1_9CYAN|nr:hypothetical protein [Chamaesiphon polymorphus]PSB58310.1 hypothetical protein C7B77_05225 [Chamaesiphon polymorphus CCALA 037]